ncbi:MAG: hypothetical protein KC636_39210 [Myxococcales bacterium]|nr:hypothetical protein [Myxococcales bacterium]
MTGQQDPRAAAYAQMAAAMQAMGPDRMVALRKAIRRRAMFFGAGAVITVTGLLLPVSLGLPVWAPSLVMILGGGLSFLGFLGPQRGSGCMAQITGVTWLLAVGCGVGTEIVAIQYVLAGSAFAFALLALLLPKPREKGPIAAMAGMANLANAARGAQPDGRSLGGPARARDRVIDIEAEEQSGSE